MKKDQKSILVLLAIFVVLLSTTLFVSFSSNLDVQEVIVKSMTPVYDETSTIEVDNNNVVFNDKNQVVKYNVVLENTQDYDVKISDITLSTPTEEFLSYKVEGISTEDEIKANSTKELTVSFETMRIDGWGRNFADELTANISFEKVAKKEEIPPVEEDKNEEKQPEVPTTNIEEIVKESEKIEVESITNNTIEFKDGFKVEDASKVEIWLYPESEFYGYKEVDESIIIKEIVLEKERLDELEITPGEHNILLTTEEKEILGYIDIYIDEDKEISEEKPQDTTDKEDLPVTKPSTDNKDDEKVENPYTSNNGLVVVFGVATFITGIAIIFLCNKKVAKYTVFILMLSPAFTITNAEEVIEVAIKNNVSFESQSVMSQSYQTEEVCYDYNKDGIIEHCSEENVYYYFWQYSHFITNIYVQNEISEIVDYDYVFDVTEEQNGRVMAYLAKRNDDLVCSFWGETDVCYDLYLQADGIIYANKNASHYFYNMTNLEYINNLAGIDTSAVTDMSSMFYYTGYNSENFTLDVSSFDTSNVTDMGSMFGSTGHNNENFTLDVSNFDTSNVTNMSGMFSFTGYNSENFTLDVSNFDTSNVTDMSSMFKQTGYSSANFTLDVSNFDTSNVTNMSDMFYFTGYNNENFTLDVSNFDTSNVTNMSAMFGYTGYNSENFTLDVSNFDTSNVTDMGSMFSFTGYNSENFTLDVSNFDISNVTDMSWMFCGTGYSSANLNISLTIKNPNTNVYSIFDNTALVEGSKITVNYTNLTKGIANRMVNTKSDGANVVLGNMVEEIKDEDLTIGDEVEINGEYFNVVSQTEDTVTLLPQYNLGTDYRQSSAQNGVRFAGAYGWEYTPGPKEIDIQTWSTSPKTYVNAYVEYLKEELGDDTVTGDLITLKDLEELGCTVPSDYGGAGRWNCNDSPYGWIEDGQDWWTRSADSTNSYFVWYVGRDGYLHYNIWTNNYGVRPVITISKSSI